MLRRGVSIPGWQVQARRRSQEARLAQTPLRSSRAVRGRIGCGADVEFDLQLIFDLYRPARNADGSYSVIALLQGTSPLVSAIFTAHTHHNWLGYTVQRELPVYQVEFFGPLDARGLKGYLRKAARIEDLWP